MDIKAKESQLAEIRVTPFRVVAATMQRLQTLKRRRERNRVEKVEKIDCTLVFYCFPEFIRELSRRKSDVYACALFRDV